MVGSIEARKRADFSVLESNPMEAATPEALKDLAVWGIVAGGQPVAAGEC